MLAKDTCYLFSAAYRMAPELFEDLLLGVPQSSKVSRSCPAAGLLRGQVESQVACNNNDIVRPMHE
jgi:hypothetical protein